MVEFVTDRAEIVKKVVALWEDRAWAVHILQTYDLHGFGWWANPRKNGGLGLTRPGDEAFKMAKLESYDFSAAGRMTSRFCALLNRKLKCPHYIFMNGNDKLTVRIYDSRIAMIIGLAGSIERYLEHQTHRNKND